jgi:hypothetical protein
MENKPCTDFLFAQASFLTGVASAINVIGNFYQFNSSATEMEADRKAIKCDWAMIGQDLRVVYEKESNKSLIKSADHEYATK